MECLPVWNLCNNKCLMCSNPRGYDGVGSYSLDSLKARVDKFDKGETDIYLTGGEPSLYPRLFELLGYIRGRFPRARIVIDTNGRMFAYPDFAGKCASFGNMEFQVSICGHSAAAHDAVTLTPGSFEQTVAGIRNLLPPENGGAAVELRFVLTGMSLRNMEKVYRFALKNLKGIKALVFIFLEMEGMAGVNKARVGLRYSGAAAAVTKFFSSAGESPFELKLYHFPLCVLPAGLWKYAWRTLPGKEILFPAGCRRCGVKKYCLGVHGDYLKFYGDGEFSPVANPPRIIAGRNPCRPVLDAIWD